MLGAIAGDIIGSVYEIVHTKRKDFRLFTPFSTFTDDTVLTVAVAEAILTSQPYADSIKRYARSYPCRGYGPRFLLWMVSPIGRPYHSFGNGSAMRVSAVAHAFQSETDVLAHARQTAECTHNHPEGIKGAQATALAVFLARGGVDKETIRSAITERFDYDLSGTTNEIRPTYRFNITCQGSVPEAIRAFLDSTSFEDAIRNAVSLGGDADTQAAIAGAIAEAYYRTIPPNILRTVMKKLSRSLRSTTLRFYKRYGTQEMKEQLNGVLPGNRGGSH